MRLLIVCCFLLLLPNLAVAEVKTIKLKHRAASELLGPIRELLDEGEKVQAAGSALVLVADGESLTAAEQLIILLDRQLMPLVVRLKLAERKQQVGEEVSAVVHYGTDTQLFATASGDRRLGNSERNLEQVVTVVEGSGAWLEVGKDIPYKRQWSAFAGDISGYSEQIAYKTVAAGFWVRPVQVIGNSVLLEIEPQINQVDDKHGQGPPQIRFSQLRSKIQIPMEVWYPIGGHLQQHDQVSQDIISWRTGNVASEKMFYLRIDPAAGFSP